MKKKILPFILIIFFNSVLAFSVDGVKVVFRYDDFLLKPSLLNDSLLNIFSRNKIPLCIGIVPFDTSGNLINTMDSVQISDLRSRISRGEVEVALHGFNLRNHLKPGWVSKSTYSEWAAIQYDVQLKKLAYGKKVLDSVLATNIRVFVPPFNTYDDNSLKALAPLGFEIISGSRQGSSNGQSIQFIPSTYEDFSSLSEIIEKNKDEDVSVIVYFHPYTFKGGSDKYSTREEGNMELRDLDSLLAQLNSGNTSFYNFSGLSETGNYNSASFRNNTMKYNLLKKVLLVTKMHGYGTLSSSGSTVIDHALTAANILLHIIVFFLVYAFVGFFLKIFHVRIAPVLIFLAAGIVPVSAYLVYIRNDYSFGIIFIMLFVIFSSLFLAILKTKKGSFSTESFYKNASGTLT
jgi:hypothetical protein